jgi:Uma2 family endonuclease
MVTIVAPKFTYQDLQEMPDDGKRYQLIDGELYVTPSPNRAHQRAVGNLHILLRERIEKPGLGVVYLAPFDVVFDQMNVVQPDLLVVGNERLAIITEANVEGVPDIAIEVLSPSNKRFDREKKLQLYGRVGAPELWYFDPADRTAEVFHAEAEGRCVLMAKLSGSDVIRSAVFPGLSLTLDEVFAG